MPNNRTKVSDDQIRSFITDNPSTIREVAIKFAVTPATARKHLVALCTVALATKSGVKTAPEGSRGRSPDLYVVKGASGAAAVVASPTNFEPVEVPKTFDPVAGQTFSAPSP